MNGATASIKAGSLLKQQRRFPYSWQERSASIVCEDGKAASFALGKGHSQPKALCELLAVYTLPGKENDFEVVDAPGSTLRFRAESPAAAREWTEAIQQHCCRGRGSSTGIDSALSSPFSSSVSPDEKSAAQQNVFAAPPSRSSSGKLMRTRSEAEEAGSGGNRRQRRSSGGGTFSEVRRSSVENAQKAASGSGTPRRASSIGQFMDADAGGSDTNSEAVVSPKGNTESAVLALAATALPGDATADANDVAVADASSPLHGELEARPDQTESKKMRGRRLSAYVAETMVKEEVDEKQSAKNVRERFLAIADVLDVVSQQVLQRSSYGMLELFQALRATCRNLLNADRSSLFLRVHSGSTSFLWTLLDHGEEVKIAIDSGLAGACATTNTIVNVPDAYKDPRFNSSVDARTGYRTRGVLCVPVSISSGEDGTEEEVVGVLQVVNRSCRPDGEEGEHDQSFSTDDATMLSAFGTLSAIAIVSAQTLEAERRAKDRYSVLSKMSKQLQTTFDLKDLFSSVALESSSLIGCERSHIYLMERASNVMWTFSSEEVGQSIISFPYEKEDAEIVKGGFIPSLLAHVANTGEVLSITNVGLDERFQSEAAKQDALDETTTKAVLALPIRNTRLDQVMGVLVVANKEDDGDFDHEDAELLESFTGYVANAILTALTYASTTNTANLTEFYATTDKGAVVQPIIHHQVQTKQKGSGEAEPRDAPPFQFIEVSLPGPNGEERPHAENLFTWEFDALQHSKADLVYFACDIFASFGVIEAYNVELDVLQAFVERVRRNYRDNPFHNWVHAFTVLQVTSVILKQIGTDINQYLTLQDIFALLVAALCHDMDHPGTTNTFHANSLSSLAVRYNDQSILEHHHSASLFALLAEKELDIFSGLSKAEFQLVRKIVCSAVLGTDMALHSKHLTQMQNHGATFDRNNLQDRELVVSMILHTADLSNPAREFDLATKWAQLLAQEFTNQTIVERELGLPVAPHMESGFRPQNEIGFIGFFVLPLWTTMAETFPCLKPGLENVEHNLKTYREQVKAA